MTAGRAWVTWTSLLLAGLVSSGLPADQGIVVEAPWVRATMAGVTVGVGYLTIRNTGDRPDRLLAVSSPLAGAVAVHETTVVDGVTRMRPVPHLRIPGGETVTLRPGGLHLMLMNLKAPLSQGTVVPIRLEFEVAGSIEVAFAVTPPGAPSPAVQPH